MWRFYSALGVHLDYRKFFVGILLANECLDISYKYGFNSPASKLALVLGLCLKNRYLKFSTLNLVGPIDFKVGATKPTPFQTPTFQFLY